MRREKYPVYPDSFLECLELVCKQTGLKMEIRYNADSTIPYVVRVERDVQNGWSTSGQGYDPEDAARNTLLCLARQGTGR